MLQLLRNIPRSYFLHLAREYRSAGIAFFATYPSGSIGSAHGRLLFAFGNLLRGIGSLLYASKNLPK